MFISQETLAYITLFGIWYVVMSIPCAVFMFYLIKQQQLRGDLPYELDIPKILLHAMATWPKLYLMLALGLLRNASNYLLNFVSKDSDDVQSENEHAAFTMLFEERLQKNRELLPYLHANGLASETTPDRGTIKVKVDRLAGTTFMVLHSNRKFLREIQQSDGTYDEDSMERLKSLTHWMVFDLVCAYPEYSELLPPEIICQISTRH